MYVSVVHQRTVLTSGLHVDATSGDDDTSIFVLAQMAVAVFRFESNQLARDGHRGTCGLFLELIGIFDLAFLRLHAFQLAIGL